MTDTKNGFHKLGTLCAYQTTKSEDFSLSQFKGAVLKRVVMDTREVIYFQKYIARCVFQRRINVSQLTANHLFYNFIITDIFHFPGAHIGTITHDGDIIRNLTELCHLMGNKYKGNTSVTQIAYDSEKCLNLIIRQGGCRLIQNDQLCFLRNCLCNFYGLHLGNGKFSQLFLGIKRHLYVIQPFLCLFIHGFMVDYLQRPYGFCRITSKVHIFCNSSCRNRLKLLVYHCKAFL